MDCNKPRVKTVNIADVAIDNTGVLPDYFLAEKDEEDATTGNIKRTPVRVRSIDIFPNASNDNVIALPINNTITVPANQVRAGYIKNEVGMPTMQFAGPSHEASFLMLGNHTDNLMRVQNAGFVNIPEGHQYILNATYYLGENGEPTTDATITGQKLFKPLSNTYLAILM